MNDRDLWPNLAKLHKQHKLRYHWVLSNLYKLSSFDEYKEYRNNDNEDVNCVFHTLLYVAATTIFL